jgi:DNA-binding NtrC family response regulator
VARILIAEPDRSLRQLLAHMVTEFGHEPAGPESSDCDVLIVEPAWEQGRRLAERLRAGVPGLPIICVSHASPSSWRDEVAPIAFLAKPFTLADLERAVADAVAQSST